MPLKWVMSIFTALGHLIAKPSCNCLNSWLYTVDKPIVTRIRRIIFMFSIFSIIVIVTTFICYIYYCKIWQYLNILPVSRMPTTPSHHNVVLFALPHCQRILNRRNWLLFFFCRCFSWATTNNVTSTWPIDVIKNKKSNEPRYEYIQINGWTTCFEIFTILMCGFIYSCYFNAMSALEFDGVTTPSFPVCCYCIGCIDTMACI